MVAAEVNHGGEGQNQPEDPWCTPGCEEGGVSELEELATRPAEPVEEEPEATS